MHNKLNLIKAIAEKSFEDVEYIIGDNRSIINELSMGDRTRLLNEVEEGYKRKIAETTRRFLRIVSLVTNAPRYHE